jgi:hypothetical protein
LRSDFVHEDDFARRIDDEDALANLGENQPKRIGNFFRLPFPDRAQEAQ